MPSKIGAIVSVPNASSLVHSESTKKLATWLLWEDSSPLIRSATLSRFPHPQRRRRIEARTYSVMASPTSTSGMKLEKKTKYCRASTDRHKQDDHDPRLAFSPTSPTGTSYRNDMTASHRRPKLASCSPPPIPHSSRLSCV